MPGLKLLGSDLFMQASGLPRNVSGFQQWGGADFAFVGTGILDIEKAGKLGAGWKEALLFSQVAVALARDPKIKPVEGCSSIPPLLVAYWSVGPLERFCCGSPHDPLKCFLKLRQNVGRPL